VSGKGPRMDKKRQIATMTYVPSSAAERNRKQLVAYADSPEERRFTFYDRIEIGRFDDRRKPVAGMLLVSDPTVSTRHCVVTQTPDGRCFVRDMSRNGTRLDGRRLMPNVEVEVTAGQIISVGSQIDFLLAGDAAESTQTEMMEEWGGTVPYVEPVVITVLVGDIRDYTRLVQKADLAAVQQAVRRVFHRLEGEVVRLGGTVKEIRGDALFAFWEAGLNDNHAVEACRAALSIDRTARELACDRDVWDVPGFELVMEWALATGPATIATTGDDRPTGLSVIGAPVVLAFRIEKFANEETGRIVACSVTREKASAVFEFENLGEKHNKGFEETNEVFALIGPKRPKSS
jgi:class 3 adenylate cyclase